ncbi:MAG: hypothetical protein CFE39_15180 [Comamonadaceae bacterium PBBC2]|nr:MAG: hypothetical protein CFE39_15180 [Comamonadaceae bacterium PBBC2]
MFKYFVIAFTMIVYAYWGIWGFFLAWGSADSGRPFRDLIRREINGKDPELTVLWLCASVYLIGWIVFAFYMLICMAFNKIKNAKKTHPKVR